MALMKELIASFPEQLKHSIELGREMNLGITDSSFNKVMILGMGGSGIGGRIVSQLVADEASIPILPVSDYSIPQCADNKTLVLVSSYSGNTEETISAMEMAIAKGSKIVCISSGGKIKDLAEEHGFPFVSIPPGNPPRSMFAYSCIQQLFVLNQLGVIGDDIIDNLSDALSLLENTRGEIEDLGKDMASQLQGRIPLIYTDMWMGGVAVRWCQQINENSKMMCWSNPFPESNHNELVGWEGADNRIGVVLVRTPFDHPRTSLRMDICKPIFDKKCDTIVEVQSKGKTKLETMLYVVLLGDWLSWYLSDLNGVDAVEITNIIHLKNSLTANVSN